MDTTREAPTFWYPLDNGYQGFTLILWYPLGNGYRGGNNSVTVTVSGGSHG